MWKGDTEGAGKALFRLEELSEYLDENTAARIKCDAVFMRRVLGGTPDEGEVIPDGARDTLEGMRAELSLHRGDKEQYKKRTAQEPAAGLRALESTFFERFIQNF